MKKRKFYRLLLAVFAAMMLLPEGKVAAQEAYVVLSDDGTLTFKYDNDKPEGAYEVPSSEWDSPEWTEQSYLSEQIEKVVFDDSFINYKPTSCYLWFFYCSNLTEIQGFENLNTSEVSNMSSMFYGCSSLTSIDLSNFTIATSNINAMFNECKNLSTIYVIDGWHIDIESEQLRYCYLFAGCDNLIGGNFTIFNATKVDATYARIDGGDDAPGYFTRKGATKPSIASIKVSTPPMQTEYSLGESFCKNIENDREGVVEAVLSNGDTRHFELLSVLQSKSGSISKFDSTKVGSQDLTVTFYGKKATLTLNVVDQDNPYSYFDESTNTLTLTYGKYQPGAYLGIVPDKYKSQVEKVIFHETFAYYHPTSCYSWFAGCENLTQIVNMKKYLDTKEVTNMAEMFSKCDQLQSIDLSNFDTKNVESMAWMFEGCAALESIDLSTFNTEKVASMHSMFSGCAALESIDLSTFNTEKVASMHSMFSGCSSLKTIDVSKFKTSNVYEFGYMFSNCINLESLDLRNFDVSNVTTTAHGLLGMFSVCEKLKTLDLSSFDTRSASVMSGMFYCCSNLETIYVGDNWSTESVIKGDYMFDGCTKLVGGNGTKFDENCIAYTYARIDGGEDAPGYFTRANGVVINTDAQSEIVADLYDNGVIAALKTATEVDKVDVHRELKKDKPSTIVLPIDMDVKNLSDYKFYEFGGVEKNEQGKWIAKYNQVENIVANTPYIVETTLSSSSDIVFNGGTGKIALQPTGTAGTTAGATGSSAEGWEFVGTYEKKVWDADSPNEFGFAANDEGDDIKAGDFVRIGAGASIKPMRSYLRYTKNDNPFSKAGEQLPDKIGVILIPLGSVVNPDDPNNDPNNGDIETPVSEIVPATNNDAKVWSYDKTIVIEAAPSTAYQVIDLGGRTLKNGVTNSSREEIVLGGKTDGMVIVMIGGKSFKIKY